VHFHGGCYAVGAPETSLNLIAEEGYDLILMARRKDGPAAEAERSHRSGTGAEIHWPCGTSLTNTMPSLSAKWAGSSGA
jgi:hypothetical protein